MGNSVEEKRVKIKHKLNYSTNSRGKASEEDTTETPMWVNKGGKHHPAGGSGATLRYHRHGGRKA
jgi:hypothetical protein